MLLVWSRIRIKRVAVMKHPCKTQVLALLSRSRKIALKAVSFVVWIHHVLTLVRWVRSCRAPLWWFSVLAPSPHYFSFVSFCVHLLVVDSWVGYEHSSFCGQQFVLERGEYPHWESWSGSNAYHIERMMSFRPICSAVRVCFPLPFLHFC